MNYLEWKSKYSGIINDKEQGAQCLEDFKSVCWERTPILYGYGLLGRNLGEVLSRLGIVWIAIDKNPVGVSWRPEILKRVDVNSVLLIASVNPLTVPSVERDIAALGTSFPAPISGHELHITLQSALCSSIEELDLKSCYECSILDNTCPVLRRHMIAGSRGVRLESKGEKAKSIKMIGYVLGNVCTLNCKGCCESIPFQKDRSFVHGSRVIDDLKRYADDCEYVTLLEFIGGEPFLHPWLKDILTASLKIPNIGVIHVFTNGTVTPSASLLDVLKNLRIAVYVSNYANALPASINEKIERNLEVLSRANVAYVRGSNANWYDISSFAETGDGEHRLHERFEACFLHNCNRLHDGKLYHCPHHFSGVTLGKLDDGDVVNIREGDLVKKLEAFAAQPYAEACRRCPMPFNAPFVVPGEQV